MEKDVAPNLYGTLCLLCDSTKDNIIETLRTAYTDY